MAADLSKHGRQMIIANRGHVMPFDSPEAIASATREIVADARDERGEQSR